MSEFDNLLNTTEVIKITGLSKTSIWRLERRNKFPAKLKISPNRVAYIESEIKDWIEQCKAERS
jgi:prophage regulatory protein